MIRPPLRSILSASGGATSQPRNPNATRLLMTADGGGSNGSRVRLLKRELQKLASELGLDVVVSHLPPGISKWSKSSTAPILHQPELACPAPGQLSGDCRTDLGYDHQNRPRCAL